MTTYAFALLSLAITTYQVFAATVLSPPRYSSVTAGGNSHSIGFSADGQHLLFMSQANNLVTNDDLGLWLDVFVRDLVTSNTVLVSVSTNGIGGANSDATYPSISSNGQFVVFASRASNLALGLISNEFSQIVHQIFRRDLLAGTTLVASLSTNGTPTIVGGFSPGLSADGRWVVFQSGANDLVERPVGAVGNDNFSLDVFARDMLGMTNILVSVTTDGIGANDNNPRERSYSPLIAPNGRHVAFLSTVLNLPNGSVKPVKSSGDVYVRDLQLGSTIWVSTNVPSIISNDAYRCSNPVLSADGRFAAFHATALTNSGEYVFRYDLQTGTTLVLTTNATNVNHGIEMTSDGRFVLFEEMDATSPYARVQLWDAQSGTTTNINCIIPDIARNATMNADATRVAFIGCSNIYVRNLVTGDTVLVSANTNGAPSGGNFTFVEPAISPDGTHVAFDVAAADLVPGDVNEAHDLFLRNLGAGATELISRALPTKPNTTSPAHSFLGPNSVSGDGRIIVSTRYDDLTYFRDTNNCLDVYIHDTLTGQSHALSIDTNLYQSELGGPPFSVENTNSYFSAIVSRDGSTVTALRRNPTGNSTLPTRQDIVWAFGSNGVFGSGMTIANRSDTGNGIGNGTSFEPSLSADGESLVFTTTSSDLIAGDNNSRADVILRRRFLGTNGLWSGSNYLVSATPAGLVGNGASSNGIISSDGRWVVFNSIAQDLVTPAQGGFWNIFVRDLWSNTTHRVNGSDFFAPPYFQMSMSSRYVAITWGQQLLLHDLFLKTNLLAYNSGFDALPRTPSVTDDGQLVAYASSSTRISVKDLSANPPEIVTQSPGGLRDPIVSPDGRYVVFRGEGNVNGLVPFDANNANDLFVRDRLLGVTLAVSVNAQGRTANSSSTRPVLAADGRTVVFQSFASDLATGDYNDKRDIFVLKLGGADTDGDGMDDDWEVIYFDNLSHDGKSDSDGDGVSDLQEFLAGTNPTDINSYFRVLTVTPAGGGGKLLFWSGNPERSYRAEFKDDLNATSWTALTGTISWNGSTASISDPSAGGSTNRFYRVARLP